MLRRDFCSTRGANRWPVSRKLIETLVFEIRTKNTKSCAAARRYYTYIRTCTKSPFTIFPRDYFLNWIYKKMYGKRKKKKKNKIQRCVIRRDIYEISTVHQIQVDRITIFAEFRNTGWAKSVFPYILFCFFFFNKTLKYKKKLILLIFN